MLRSLLDLIQKTYTLVRPYGLKRLMVVFFFILAQGLFQVIGVTSIFPFLSLAADLEGMRETAIGQWVDDYLPSMTDQQLLIWAGLAVVFAVILSSVMSLVSEVVRTMYVHRFSHWLRMRLLWRYLDRPYGYFLHNHSGVMLKKVSTDVNGFTNSVLLALLDAAARAVTSLLLFATLFLVSWQIALAATIGICLYYVSIFAFLRGRRRKLSDGMKQAFRGGWVTLQHLFGGIKPIMVHGVQETFAAEYSSHSKKLMRLAPMVPVFSNSPRHFIEPFLFGGMIVFVLILTASGRSVDSILPQLGVLGLAGYRMLPAVQLLYTQITSMDGMRYTLDEVYDEFHEVEEYAEQSKKPVVPKSPTDQPLTLSQEIRISDVSFNYGDAATPAVRNVSLSIPRGGSVAFVGPSGSGKSTLVDIIIGLHSPKSGAISIDGRQLDAKLMSSWRRSIGYVPQDIFLLDATLTENIAFGIPKKDIDAEKIRKVAKQAQILDFIEGQLPQGFDTKVGERGVRLSGGQRQRIGLARALYHDPQVLVLDEATSALDSRTEAAFMKSVESLQGDITIIMIAHRLSTVENCDLIYYLENGQVVDSGRYNELILRSSGFSKLALLGTEDNSTV